MSLFNTQHKRKSAGFTALILLLLMVGVFNFGMRYFDPPEEYGLAINFGDSTIGTGEAVQKTTKKVPAPKAVENEEVVQQVKETPKEVIKEEMITNNNAEAVPVFEKIKEEKKEPVKKEISTVTPKLSKETTDALSSLLNGNASENQPKGEGDDAKEGVKGNKKGDANANRYSGNTESGSDGNYNLAGRKVLLKPKKQPDCQEEGIVVVEIMVDHTGKVIYANPGVQGSNNTALCLLKAAKEAALNTQWNAVSNARLKQPGTIIYKFSLSE
jgi:outer membrane biosynthesis protein TonB